MKSVKKVLLLLGMAVATSVLGGCSIEEPGLYDDAILEPGQPSIEQINIQYQNFTDLALAFAGSTSCQSTDCLLPDTQTVLDSALDVIPYVSDPATGCSGQVEQFINLFQHVHFAYQKYAKQPNKENLANSKTQFERWRSWFAKTSTNCNLVYSPMGDCPPGQYLARSGKSQTCRDAYWAIP